ncbi:hypothetical protein [Thalassotalea crassostreae]|uniref:hypothetical protein n=1 Tax=Thalassotalea crassostreae TaxID=1763536 RepID=UPI0012FD5945|nr:hypothetical protein [Thalassotalea crassostreae]
MNSKQQRLEELAEKIIFGKSNQIEEKEFNKLYQQFSQIPAYKSSKELKYLH